MRSDAFCAFQSVSSTAQAELDKRWAEHSTKMYQVIGRSGTQLSGLWYPEMVSLAAN